MKAVIPAAGLGTRLLPATKSMPKEMLPVVDKPVIQYVVEEAVEAGFDEILIVTGRGKRAIEDHFDHSVELEAFLQGRNRGDQLERLRSVADGAKIHYVRQREPLGLGHAVLCARSFVGSDDFAVLLGDDIFVGSPSPMQALRKAHEEFDAPCLAVLEVPSDALSRYGVILPDPIRPGVHGVKAMVEKPKPSEAPSRLAAMGRYLLTPDLFPLLAATPPGHGGEIQLTDGLAALLRKRRLLAIETECRRLDVGTFEGFLEANVYLGLRRLGLPARELVVACLEELDRAGNRRRQGAPPRR